MAAAVQLHYETSGAGEPLIMLHGMFGSFENLGAISRILVDHFTLIRVDLRNHGRSSHASSMSFAEMAKDVCELQDALGLSSSYFFGHSLGGKVAMQIALNSPARVRKLIVADIAPVNYPSHHNAILEALRTIDPSNAQSRADVDTQLQTLIPELPVRQFILKNLARNDAGKFYWRINVPAVLANYDNLRLAVGDGQVCQTPTLFLRGENSKYIQPRNEAEIASKFPHSRIVSIPNASHWLHAERPALVAEQVIQFLKSE